MRIIVLLSIAALAISGCASTGLSGKTTYIQTFEDIEAATADGPGQTTKYGLNIKAPAGVKLDELTSMTYKWSPTEGLIAVNSDSKTDTTLQAQAIVEVTKMQTDLINSLTQALISAAAPIVGTKVQGDVQNQAASIANRAQLQALIADMVNKAIAAQQPPANPLPVNPLVDEARLPR